MTTELEKQFFSTFGIKKRLISPCKHLVQNMYCDEDDICRDTYFNPFPNCVGYADCREDYKRKDERYPTITDRHYLELICVSSKELIKRFDISGSDLESIKKNILSQCIKDYTFYSNTLCETYNRLGENFKHQVQAIFKESEQE